MLFRKREPVRSLWNHSKTTLINSCLSLNNYSHTNPENYLVLLVFLVPFFPNYYQQYIVDSHLRTYLL